MYFGKLDLQIWNFLPKNILTFIILQKNRHTTKLYPLRSVIIVAKKYVNEFEIDLPEFNVKRN
jgi:hypothetical protein